MAFAVNYTNAAARESQISHNLPKCRWLFVRRRVQDKLSGLEFQQDHGPPLEVKAQVDLLIKQVGLSRIQISIKVSVASTVF